MKPLTQEQIDKASAWWAEAVCAPRFQGEEPGHETTAMVFGSFLARAAVKHVSNHQKLQFRQEVARALAAADRRAVYYVGCDYHPDPLLADAAKKAGIPETNFPWKTSMWLKEDGAVMVQSGYRGETIDL